MNSPDKIATLLFLGRDGAIETAARSQSGSTERRDMRPFPYEKNTAFTNILDQKRPFYLSNYLRLRSFLGTYHNAHDGWQKSYRKTCVVPITSAADSSYIDIDNTFGFVCVDSRSGKFNKNVTPLLLAIPASRCVMVLLRLSEAQDA